MAATDKHYRDQYRLEAYPGGVSSTTYSTFDAANRLVERYIRQDSQTLARVQTLWWLSSVTGYSTDVVSTRTFSYQPSPGSAYTTSATVEFGFVPNSMRVSSLTYKKADASVIDQMSYSYYDYAAGAYDPYQRLRRETRSAPGGPEVFNYQFDIAYDANNRVTRRSPETGEIDYDASGNISNAGLTFGADNRITSNGYTYNYEGAVTSQTISGVKAWEFKYDHANRLTEITRRTLYNVTQFTISYRYDAEGRRIAADFVPNGTGNALVYGPEKHERYVYEGEHIVAQLTSATSEGTPALELRYLRGEQVDRLFARVGSNGAASSWYLTDRQYSVIGLIDFDGAPQQRIRYDAFGKPTHETSFVDNYGYTGREYDRRSELQHNRARDYHPEHARWMQQDPMGFAAGDMNLYRYVSANPVNYRDPSGLISWNDIFGNPTNGWFSDFSNFSAGAGDTVSFGLTERIREAAGINDVVDKNSTWYRVGGYAGTVINIGLMLTPAAAMQRLLGSASWVGAAARGLQMVNRAVTVHGLAQAGEAVMYGDFTAAGMAIGNVALARMRGAGGAQSRLACLCQRAMAVAGVATATDHAAQRFESGDWLGAGLDLITAGIAGVKAWKAACFSGDTQLMARSAWGCGWRRIDQITTDDEVLSRDENDVNGTLRWKKVEETFVREGLLLHLHVGGQLIKTTGEHPFYTYAEHGPSRPKRLAGVAGMANVLWDWLDELDWALRDGYSWPDLMQDPKTAKLVEDVVSALRDVDEDIEQWLADLLDIRQQMANENRKSEPQPAVEATLPPSPAPEPQSTPPPPTETPWWFHPDMMRMRRLPARWRPPATSP